MRTLKTGYTLLEVLVVLVIISIVAGMAMLSLGHNENKELQAFTRELAEILSLAEEQALLQPTTLGLMLRPHSFGLYEYRKTQHQMAWQALNDRELGIREMPADTQIILQIANQTVSQEEQGEKPPIIISTNGTLTPFTMLIGKKNKKPRYKLSGLADGTISAEVYLR
ncbi:MAG TPA: type II secretion system minor pseudopilin GspH [Gammaproteobacteria bacterium]|nr:type II secretion system minor pseudopilin GspH [Gammaproteobacteria bacterium]